VGKLRLARWVTSQPVVGASAFQVAELWGSVHQLTTSIGPSDLACVVRHRTGCLQSITPILMDRLLLLLRRGPSTPSVWALFLPTWFNAPTRSAEYQTFHQGTVLLYPLYCLSGKLDLPGSLDACHSLATITPVLLETLISILQSRSQCSSLLLPDEKGWLLEPRCLRTVLTRCSGDSVGVSYTNWLNTTETSLPNTTPVGKLRRVTYAYLKDVWSVRQWRYEDMIFTRQDGKFRLLSL
jgi:hypothetical protein